MGQFAGGGEAKITPYKKIVLRLTDTSGTTTAIPLVDEVGAGTWTLAVTTPGTAVYTLSSSVTTGIWDVTKVTIVGSSFRNFFGDICITGGSVMDSYEIEVQSLNTASVTIDGEGAMNPNIITIYVFD